jgi:hypothetical protein
MPPSSSSTTIQSISTISRCCCAAPDTLSAFDKAQAALSRRARSLSRSFPDLPVIAGSDMGPRSQPLFFGMMLRLGARASFVQPLDDAALPSTVARLVRGAQEKHGSCSR